MVFVVLPDLLDHPRRADSVPGTVIKVVGENLVLVADDHLIAQDDRVVGEFPVVGDRRRRVNPATEGAIATIARRYGGEFDAPLQRADVDRARYDFGAGGPAG